MIQSRTYSVAELAHAWQCSPSTVRSRVRGDGPYPAWPHTRVGREARFTLEQVRQIVDNAARGWAVPISDAELRAWAGGVVGHRAEQATWTGA